MNYIEIEQEHVYLVSTIDQEEDRVFITFDFNEAGKRYAELKVKGDAIVWHIKTKDLGRRILNDFERPIEIVDDERLLRIMSLIISGDDLESSDDDSNHQVTDIPRERRFGDRIVEMMEGYRGKPSDYIEYTDNYENSVCKRIVAAIRYDIDIKTSFHLSKLANRIGTSFGNMVYKFTNAMNDEEIKLIKDKHLTYNHAPGVKTKRNVNHKRE